MFRRLWWYFWWFVCLVWMHVCYRYRSRGSRHIPRTGSFLLVANHQSTLDPIIVGVAAYRRKFHAMARSGLFDNPIFGWFIRTLGAFSVEQGTADLKAMRTGVEVLRNGDGLLLFPEGARTLDGEVHEFATGTMLLIKRARPLVIPVAIDGAYEVFPRGAKVPRPFGRLRIRFGEPITADELLAMGNEEALAHLRRQVETLRQELVKR